MHTLYTCIHTGWGNRDFIQVQNKNIQMVKKKNNSFFPLIKQLLYLFIPFNLLKFGSRMIENVTILLQN